MKQKDIALIVIVVAFSAVISVVVSNFVFGSPSNRTQKAEVVQPITTDFQEPDSHYFNTDAFDPTKIIQISPNQNTDPFSGSQ